MITNLNDALSALSKFLPYDELAYDTETSGLNTRRDKVIGFGASDGTNSAYFCHLAWDGQQLVEVLTHAECIQILNFIRNLKPRLVLWNTSFDIRFTRNYFGVDLLPYVYSDGMLSLHTIQEEGIPFSHRPFGLKSVGAHFLGAEVTAEQDDLKASVKAAGGSGGGEIYRADPAIIARYCIQDCNLTLQLDRMFRARIEAEGLSDFYHTAEVMPMVRDVLVNMESCGLPVDVPALEAAHAAAGADLIALEQEIQSEIKPLLIEFEEWFLNKDYPPKRTGPFAQAFIELFTPGALPRTDGGSYSLSAKAIEGLTAMEHEGLYRWLKGEITLPPQTITQVQRQMHGSSSMFNLLSKHHLKKLFFEKLGETALSTTDLGAPQVDEAFLDSMVPKYPWVAKLIDYNKLTKIRSAYIGRLLEEHEDGVWYPSFSLHRTISGRLGSDAQQFPRPLEEGQASPVVLKYNNMIRHFFKARSGEQFTGADYESLEPKVFSHVSTDSRLQDIFRKGHDFYSTIAIMTEGLTQYSADKKAPNYLGKVNKAKRQAAKPYSLGIPYGMSGYKLQFELNIPQKEADQLVRNYLQAFPDLANWMSQTQSEVLTKGRIKVETGRVRRFPRAVSIFKQYGDPILHDLELWKKYHEEPGIYMQAKKSRRELKNYINNGNNIQIQGLAASIVNRACINIARQFKAAGLSTKICLQVHDEVVAYGPIAETRQVHVIMQECMEQVYKLSVPLVAEPNSAETYGGTK
jgi:DNA polymerase I-like protein with 3'-5' exonuclease and polymerase domains